MSKNLTYPNATYFASGLQTDVGLLLNENLSAHPTSSTSWLVYRYGGDLYLWDGSSSTKLNDQAGGGDGGGSLDSAYSIGQSITVDEGPLTLNDATAGALHTLALVKTGAGSGNIFDISVDAALTGDAIALDMNLGVAARGIYIDNGATARTGADIQVNSDSTGAHSIIDINASGSGASVGFDWTGSFNGSPAGHVFLITFDANDNLDTELMRVTTNTGDRGIMFDLNFGHTDAGTTSHIFDIDVTAILDSNIFDFATTAACTGNVINMNLDNAVAMTGLHIEGSGVRTQPFIELITDSTSSASLIDISVDGAITGAAAIDIDMNLGLAAAAILIDAGNGIRTADLIDVTFDGSGNVAFLDLNNSNTGSGHLFDIVTSGIHTGNVFNVSFTAAATGHVLNVDMNANLAGSFLVLDYGAGTRTEDMIQVTFDGDGTAPFWDINISNTGAGGTADWMDIDVSGVYTGSIIDINYSAAATGDAISIVLGSAVGAKALYLTAAGARTDDVIEINDASTSNSSVFDINMSGAFTGNLIDIDSSAAASGNIFNVSVNTANYSGDIFNGAIDANATSAQFIVFDRAGGANNANLIDITDSTTGSGDLFALTLDAAGSGMVFDINLSAVHTGNVLDVTYSVGAATGNAIDLNMGTNVAGMAISVTSAATGTSGEGSAFDVQHTGDLAAGADLFRIESTGSPSSTSNLVSLEQNTGAGTAGANVLHIKASGTNVEAIEIEEGNVFFAAVTATPGAGNDETLPITANVIFYDPNGASRTGVILTAGARDGHHVKVVNIANAAETITFAASGVSNVAPGATLVIGQNEGVELVWNAATSLWYPLITVFA